MSRLIRISFQMFFRDKKSKIVMAIMGFIFFLGTILSFYQKGAEKMFNKYGSEDYIQKTIVVGKLNVSIKNQKEELRQIQHVKSVFNLYDLMSNRFFSEELKTNNTNGLIVAYTSDNETIPNIVAGSNFPDNEGFYMICPEDLYAQTNLSGTDLIKEITNKDKIDMKKYIGKTIDFSYSAYDDNGKNISKNIEVDIVGVYKSNEHITEDNICYMNENLKKSVYYNIYSSMDSSLYELDENSLFIVMDDYSNYNAVVEELNKLGYSYDFFYEIDEEFLVNLKSSLNLFCFIIITISFILIVLLFGFCFYKNVYHFKLFEYLGYNENDISVINLVYNVIISINSLVFAIILSFLYQYVMKVIIYFRPFIFNKYEIIFSIDYMFIVFFVSFCFILILSVICNQLFKKVLR